MDKLTLEIGDSVKTTTGQEGRISGIDSITNQIELDTVLTWVKLSQIIRVNGIPIDDYTKLSV